MLEIAPTVLTQTVPLLKARYVRVKRHCTSPVISDEQPRKTL